MLDCNPPTSMPGSVSIVVSKALLSRSSVLLQLILCRSVLSGISSAALTRHNIGTVKCEHRKYRIKQNAVIHSFATALSNSATM